VTPGSNVEDLDVVEDICAGRCAGFADAFADAFLLQSAEEGFGDRIVPAVATPAPAGLWLIGLAETPPVVTAVWCALIGMHDGRL